MAIEPRPDWRDKVTELGLLYHRNPDGTDYWNESAYYEFTAEEIQELESATNTLDQLCLLAVEHVVSGELYERFGISAELGAQIGRSWRESEPSLYGRFDFSYDGIHPPKLLEYNADTPTALLEAAVVQWHWLEAIQPDRDQFNSIWEHLVRRWVEMKDQGQLGWGHVHFASADSVEDFMTITLLQDTAAEAGLQTESLFVSDIGFNSGTRQFVDLKDRPIVNLFKLYPWEWIVREPFGAELLRHRSTLRLLEPLWKMVLSNKAILPLLWQLFPDCPFLLETYSDGPNGMEQFVRKPILGREGANVSIFDGDQTTETDGVYNYQQTVYQQFCPLPEFGGMHPVIGSWVVDGDACGVGIRESDSLVTTNLSRFVPHLFD